MCATVIERFVEIKIGIRKETFAKIQRHRPYCRYEGAALPTWRMLNMEFLPAKALTFSDF